MTNTAIENAEEVIERFGGIRPMATKTNIPVTTIQGWKKRGTIPASRRAEIIECAKNHNIELSDLLNPANENENRNNVAKFSIVSPPAENYLMHTIEEKMKDMEKRAVRKSAAISAILVVLSVIAILMVIWPHQKRFESNAVRRTALQTEFTGEQQTPLPVKIQKQMGEKFADLKLQAQTKSGELIAQTETAVKDAIPAVQNIDMDSLLIRFNELKQSVTGEAQLEEAMRGLSTYITSLTDIENDAEMNAVIANAREQNESVRETLQDVPQEDLKAAALLLAMTQMRTSLNRSNKPFQDDYVVLKNLSADNVELQAALDRLAPYAQSGILTPAGLQSEFKTVAGNIVFASLKGEDVSVQEKAVARLNELVELQKNGELVTGTETQAKLARTENLLAEGNLEEALSELQSMKGAGRAAAQPFIDKIRAASAAQDVKAILANLPGFSTAIQPYDFGRN